MGQDKGGKSPPVNVHEGHRERLRQRFIEHGLDNFNDINVLELLLCYTIPRRDTNAVAHSLLDRFGSLHGVLEADRRELCDVEGVGEYTATFLTLIPAVARRYSVSRDSPERRQLVSSRSAGEFLVSVYMYERVETACMICLDSAGRMLCLEELSRGVVDSTAISVRKIAETALMNGAKMVILAHNHVRGLLEPSDGDLEVTRQAARTLRAMGIELVDHIIVMGGSYFSMGDRGLIGGGVI